MMKEEAGKMLRGSTRALVGLAAAGLVASSGQIAQAQENLYENIYGLNSNSGVVANAGLNPNGVGQLLYGSYYDVRAVDGDAQHVNIQILNNNTNVDSLPECTDEDFYEGNAGSTCYNPYGGILAKVRFRDFRKSRELLDFNIALSCGEVWAGAVTLGDSVPVITSIYPIVTAATSTTISTDDVLVGGQPFSTINALADDQNRGYFEVIAMEALPCEPDDGSVELSGDDWERINCYADDCTPGNALSAEVFVVRTASGVSHQYTADAISRFIVEGSITPANIFADDEPTAEDCVNEYFSSGLPLSASECVSQVNLALSKSRVMAQYDVEAATAGKANMAITLPTKSLVCGSNYNGPASGPFQCITDQAGDPDIGEEITCTVYDRLENYAEEDQPIFSPSPSADTCILPYEMTILGIAESAADVSEGADVALLTGLLPYGDSGWIDLGLVTNPLGAVLHREVLENPLGGEVLNIQGLAVLGYRGLPAIALVAQEFQNGNVGGTYGNVVPATAETTVLFAGQS